jgi:hypothetical protein
MFKTKTLMVIIFILGSAVAVKAGVFYSFGMPGTRRSVSNSRRSKLCPFSSRVTSKVARHPRASMLGLRGAGLASLLLGLHPELDQRRMASAYWDFNRCLDKSSSERGQGNRANRRSPSVGAAGFDTANTNQIPKSQFHLGGRSCTLIVQIY